MSTGRGKNTGKNTVASSNSNSGSAGSKLNLISAVRDYIMRIVESVPGVKVLVLDQETSGIVGMVLSQTKVLERDVFLFEKLEDDKRNAMPQIKALVFVRPTAHNVKLLCAELRDPKYQEYHLFFSNVLERDLMNDIALSDEHEVVFQLQELYADYFAVNEHLITLNLPTILPVMDRANYDHNTLQRISDGIISLCLSVKKKPCIRYLRSSDLAKTIAADVWDRMEKEKQLFDFRKSPDSNPILLVLDRKDDPITPLLTQWTYQAMVHQFFGINNNRVDLHKVPGIKDDLKEIVLSAEQDEFFNSNIYKNFGDLCVNLKRVVEDFKQQTNQTKNLTSLGEMQSFIENYAQYHGLSSTVSKHVAVVTTMRQIIDEEKLLDVSQLEQEMICSGNRNDSFKSICEMMQDTRHIADEDVIRLVILFALRFEDDGGSKSQLTHLMTTMVQLRPSISAQRIKMVDTALKHYGIGKRNAELFGAPQNVSSFIRNLVSGLKDVTNVYTQHSPYLKNIMTDVKQSKLREQLYPFIGAVPSNSMARVTDLFIFVCGGVTYEESLFVQTFMQENPGMNIMLGGTTIHNTTTFMREIQDLQESNISFSHNSSI